MAYSCPCIRGFWLLLCIFDVDEASLECKIHFNQQYQGLQADCNYRGLRSVPGNLPASIMVLNLAGNNLELLQANVFESYGKLRELSLSKNVLSKFDKDTFNGLSQLLRLDIQGNIFHLNSRTFPRGIFRPFKNLQYLNLGNSQVDDEGGDFPDYIFENLTSLKELNLDIWPAESEHSSGLARLTQLEKLTINGVGSCSITGIDNNTFSILEKSPLVSLDIYCYLMALDAGAAWPLKGLKRLGFTTTYISTVSLGSATAFLQPFAGTEMKVVNLKSLQSIRDYSYVDSILDKKTMSYLLYICVETLNLSKNKLTGINQNIVNDYPLWRCVKHLDLSENAITEHTFWYMKLYFLVNLEVFDFPNYESFQILPKTSERVAETASDLTFICPPKLRYFSWHSDKSLDHDEYRNPGNLTFVNCSNLAKLEVSSTGHYDITGYVTGLSGLKHLIASDNSYSESMLSRTDFKDSLETLVAKRCLIKFDLKRSQYFLSMKNLYSLDLSSTGLQTIELESFRKLHQVKFLTLRGNKFDNIPEEFAHMPSLIYLDLSQNVLRTIPEDTRSALDDLNVERSPFILLLEGNLFLCSCTTLDFIKWLVETEVSLDASRNYSCITDDGAMTDTLTFYGSYLCEWRKCGGKVLFICTLMVKFVLILSLIAIFIMQKYLPKIEYYFLKTLGYETEEPPKRRNFAYDGYICYDNSRYQWPCRQLFPELKKVGYNIRLYLPDLHEEVGEVKAEAIMEAIRDSWKVVIVVSEACFADEWFYFAVVTAVRLLSTNSAISRRIILLYKDNSPEVRARVPEFLVNVIAQDNVVDVTDDPEFWIRLHRMILKDIGPEALF